MVDDFNSRDSSTFVFLISTKAGGMGLNLPAANKVVIIDPSWNPADDLQAMDRAFRMGQLRDVNVYRLVAGDTIEEAVHDRQVYKQQQSRSAIEGSRETRLFRGVQGDRFNKGELFGMLNLLDTGMRHKVRDKLAEGAAGNADPLAAGGHTIRDYQPAVLAVAAGAGKAVKPADEDADAAGVGALAEAIIADVPGEADDASGRNSPADGAVPGRGGAEDADHEHELLQGTSMLHLHEHGRILGAAPRDADGGNGDPSDDEDDDPSAAGRGGNRGRRKPRSQASAEAALPQQPLNALQSLAAWCECGVQEMAQRLCAMTEAERTQLRTDYAMAWNAENAEHSPSA